MDNGFVYCLRDRMTLADRYVGETALPLHERLIIHFGNARLRHDDGVGNWVYRCIQANEPPLIILLEEVPKVGDAVLDKKARTTVEKVWIKKLREGGADLLNKFIGPKGEEIRAGFRARILETIKQQAPIRAIDVLSHVGLKPSTGGNYIKLLERQGLIRREGNTHRARWFPV